MNGGEDVLLRWLRRTFGGATATLVGDDAAHLEGGRWVVTVDGQVCGVHYPAWLPPARVAERLLAVNLSDLAAVGAAPAFAFLALTAPHGYDHRAFLIGLRRGCRRYGVTLAGGDLAHSPTAVATLTLLGRVPRGGRFVGRDGGREGDRLWLGGTVGESALGLRLLAAGATLVGRRPRPPAGLRRGLRTPARRALQRHLSP